MFRVLVAPVLTGLLLTTAAFAAPTMVKSVDVAVDLTAVTNVAAAKEFATLADDLKNALTVRLLDRTAEDGVAITIDLSEFELSNSYSEKMGLADTRLVGDISFDDGKTNAGFPPYQLTVDVNSRLPFLPEGTDVKVLPVNDKAYYTAMIAAFADGVVTRLPQ